MEWYHLLIVAVIAGLYLEFDRQQKAEKRNLLDRVWKLESKVAELSIEVSLLKDERT